MDSAAHGRDRPDGGARLRAGLTYAEVGASLGVLPRGYDHLDEVVVLGHGRACFEAAGAAVLRCALQRAAGFHVTTTPVESGADVRLDPGAARSLAPGVEVHLSPGPGWLRRALPWGLWPSFACRVVAVVDEERRRGFAYGTLPGHPERGEESFVVEWAADDAVTLRVRAFSTPHTWWARLAAPATRRAQRVITRRYLRALVSPGASSSGPA
ncbi:MAG: DUF1990 domain-containing protein [Micrococcus sp.]|nr:DUF1990 domain-containing protein [Micrococcus sp.]